MHHNNSLRAISNVLALVVILVGALYGLEALGLRTGIPELLVCQVGQPLVTGTLGGLIPWGVGLGMLLLVLPPTRSVGITLLVLSIGGLVLIELWQGLTAGFCGGAAGQSCSP